MQSARALRRLLQSMVLAACCAAGTSYAQLNVNISLAPPAPQYEVMPPIPSGYVWAPGYWTWHGDRYIWIRGRPIAQRSGYLWEPDRWEHRGDGYYRHAGRWERDAGDRMVKVKKEKKEKKEKHWKDDDDRGGGKHGGGKHKD